MAMKERPNVISADAGPNIFQDESGATDLLSESLLEIAWRNRWIILLTVVLSLILAVVYLHQATPIYRSTSRVYVEQSGPRIINELEEGVMTRSKNYLYTQAELVTSTPILSAALEKNALTRMRTFADVDNPVAYLEKRLAATVGKKDDLISVSFDSPFPTEAANLVNAVVDEYITYHANRKRNTSAEVLKILQTEKTKRSLELSEKLAALTDFRKKNLAVSFDTGQGNLFLRQIERLSNLLTDARMATGASESRFESMKSMTSDPVTLRQFIESQGANSSYQEFAIAKAQLQTRLSDLQARRADRVRQLTPQHPGIAALDAEIAQVRQKLSNLDLEFAHAQLAVAEQRYLAAKTQEEQIARQLDEQQQAFAEINEKLTQYMQLQSEYDQTRKLCDILDDRIKELNITEDVGALNISILEVARPADEPSEPQKAKILALALGFGLMLGGGLALARQALDQRLRTADEVSALLGIPVLGMVPAMSRKEPPTVRGRMTHLRSQSHTAEAYRTIRTAVFFGAPKAEGKIILVTSASPGEGKSTMVSNLGIAMAQAGQRVLIIDADFRRPMQSTIFGLNHEDLGLGGVLAESVRLEEAIQRSGIENLDILTCGPHISNPSELLNSKGFAEVLHRLAGHYDRVLLDSPPVGLVTDAQILAGISQITILVLNTEKSKRKAVCYAYDNLRAVNARLLGVVMNQVRQGNGRHGYYGTYGGYYRQEEQSAPADQSATRQGRGVVSRC